MELVFRNNSQDSLAKIKRRTQFIKYKNKNKYTLCLTIAFEKQVGKVHKATQQCKDRSIRIPQRKIVCGVFLLVALVVFWLVPRSLRKSEHTKHTQHVKVDQFRHCQHDRIVTDKYAFTVCPTSLGVPSAPGMHLQSEILTSLVAVTGFKIVDLKCIFESYISQSLNPRLCLEATIHR